MFPSLKLRAMHKRGKIYYCIVDIVNNVNNPWPSVGRFELSITSIQDKNGNIYKNKIADQFVLDKITENTTVAIIYKINASLLPKNKEYYLLLKPHQLRKESYSEKSGITITINT